MLIFQYKTGVGNIAPASGDFRDVAWFMARTSTSAPWTYAVFAVDVTPGSTYGDVLEYINPFFSAGAQFYQRGATWDHGRERFSWLIQTASGSVNTRYVYDFDFTITDRQTGGKTVGDRETAGANYGTGIATINSLAYDENLDKFYTKNNAGGSGPYVVRERDAPFTAGADMTLGSWPIASTLAPSDSISNFEAMAYDAANQRILVKYSNVSWHWFNVSDFATGTSAANFTGNAQALRNDDQSNVSILYGSGDIIRATSLDSGYLIRMTDTGTDVATGSGTSWDLGGGNGWLIYAATQMSATVVTDIMSIGGWNVNSTPFV